MSILVDRSRSTSDWQCPRRRYLNYELDGRGVVPTGNPLALEMGTVIHEALAEIARASMSYGAVADIDAIAYNAQQRLYAFLTKDCNVAEGFLYAQEQSTLVEGILRGFYKHQWPRLLAQYPKILAVEQEMTYEFGHLLFMAKPDLVAVDANGEIAYIEYKSTSYKDEDWINSWQTAVQLHSTTRAIEAALGEKISHIVVQGLYKGFKSYGKQSSPFCYAYKRTGTPPFSSDAVKYEYAAGFKRFPVWEMDGGVKAWVAAMPEDILSNQFPATPPIFVNDDLVEDFFAQRNIREQEIALATGMFATENAPEIKRAILNRSFPQRFDQCTPFRGHACPYMRICHGQVDKPLEQGFSPRAAHHAPEADAWSAEDATDVA